MPEQIKMLTKVIKDYKIIEHFSPYIKEHGEVA